MQWLRNCGVSVLGLLLWASVAGAADYEVPRDRSAKDIVGPAMLKGQYYQIRDQVIADGYMDRWTVNSDFGAFEAQGDGALRRLLREIWAIGELKKVSKSKEFAKGVAGAAKAPIGLAKSLITNPVDTISGVPKGMYQLVEDVGTSATTTKDPSEDAKWAQALKMSSFKRDIAAQLGVDPYSSNKVLQKEMNSVAWAATLGDWAFSAAMLPAGVGGTVVSNVRLANSVKNVLQQEPPARLRQINDEKFRNMGIPEDLRTRYLASPIFSPWHDTIIAANLEQLEAVTGRDAFLALALTAADEVEANFYTTMVQILRGYHQTVSPLTQITTVGRLTVAQTKQGQALIALPVDYLIWAPRVDQTSANIKANHRGAGFNGKFDLWAAGTLSPTARQQLEGRGYKVAERVNTRVEILE